MRSLGLGFAAAALLWIHGGEPVVAWGPLGHEIVCEIAFQEIGPEARAEVKRLIRQDAEYSTFAAACNWPDRPKRRAEQHYVNLPRSATRITTEDCPPASSCIFDAIRYSREMLGRSTVTDRIRLEELKFLGHWIGNLHQPLHVSFADDRGGNEIEARGDCEDNLHWAWDSCLVDRHLGRGKADRRRIAADLRRRYAGDLDGWRGGDLVEWADESFQLVRDPALGYCFRREDGCWYAPDRREYRDSEPQRIVTVDERYLDRHRATVERRLTQAGVRLAAELDRIWPSD